MPDAPRPAGHLLWRVTQGGKVAEARLRLTADGHEFYVVLGDQMWFARPFPRDAAGEAIALESSGTLNNLLGHGWTLAVEPETLPRAWPSWRQPSCNQER